MLILFKYELIVLKRIITIIMKASLSFFNTTLLLFNTHGHASNKDISLQIIFSLLNFLKATAKFELFC